MRYRLATFFAFCYALAFVAGAYCAGEARASTDRPLARSVALADASVAPTWKRTLAPGAYVHAPTCKGGGFPSDVGAYRADGSAMSGQRWDKRTLRYYWRSLYGARGRVTYDGATFRNNTSAPRLVAQWCEGEDR